MAKPGDHPEFFRYPAPEGRSRESTIVLDEQGRFWHDGDVVEKPSMNRAFAQWVDKHPDDGRFILQNGYDWTYFSVEDAPFFVTALRPVADELPELRLNDDSLETLDPSTLHVDKRGALYCRVKSGRFEARFQPSVQNGLNDYLVPSKDGGVAFFAAGNTWPVTTGRPDEPASHKH